MEIAKPAYVSCAAMTETLTLGQARATWWQLQALGDDAANRDLATVIGGSGWLRTLGGTDVYLAARARRRSMRRAELDAAVVEGALRVLPAVRGCIYLVPAAMVGDLLALNAEAWRKTTDRELAKVKRSLDDIEQLAGAVHAALTTPMTTDAVRKAMPPGSIPSFGEAGKKVGLSSPLPLALRMLEFDGLVERTLDGGRLDSERYLWRRATWKIGATAPDRESRIANVVAAFLAYAGPATIEHIACWSLFPKRDIERALARLGATRIAIEGSDAWVRSGDDVAARRAPPPSGIRLLAFEDNYLIIHGGLAAVTDPRHHGIEVAIWGGEKPEALGDADHVISRTIVVDGLIAGFWEVDPRTRGGVWMTFDAPGAPLAVEIDDAVADTAKFLLDDVGNATVYSQDTMELVQDRADRIAKLRDGASKPVKKAIAAKRVKKKPAPKARPKAKAPRRR
jgi:hypothetical protein